MANSGGHVSGTVISRKVRNSRHVRIGRIERVSGVLGVSKRVSDVSGVW